MRGGVIDDFGNFTGSFIWGMPMRSSQDWVNRTIPNFSLFTGASSTLPMHSLIFTSSVSERERVHDDFGRKSRPNFALLPPVKIRAGISESRFQVQHRAPTSQIHLVWSRCVSWESKHNFPIPASFHGAIFRRLYFSEWGYLPISNRWDFYWLFQCGLDMSLLFRN